jgi:hypothetical protein
VFELTEGAAKLDGGRWLGDLGLEMAERLARP